MDNKTAIAETASRLASDAKTVSCLVDGLAMVFKDQGAKLSDFAIPGFGRFITEMNQEHVGTDPHSGKRTLFPPSITISFAPSSILCKKITDKAQ